MGVPLGFPSSYSDPWLDLAGSQLLPKSSSPTPCGRASSSGSVGCPLNMCCSKGGFCGNTDSYCSVDQGCQSSVGPCHTVPPPQCNSSKRTASSGRSIGYYSGSNVHVRPCDIVRPQDIDVSRYTHLYYTFANINPTTFAVEQRPQDNDTMYRAFTALSRKSSTTTTTTRDGKRARPPPETWIAVGGGNFSSSPGSDTYTTWSDMASTAENRAAFVKSLVAFMEKYGFQGVDLDWEYPGIKAYGGASPDTEKLVRLVKDMRDAFGRRFGISMVLPHHKPYLMEYDLKALEPYVDSFGFMAYDLHGIWEKGSDGTGKVQGQADIREIGMAMTPLWSAGVDPAKINLGLPYYGRGYTLKSETCADLGCTFTGPSVPGKCAQSRGIMMLSEIQQLLGEGTAKSSTIPGAMMKKLTWSDQWVGYDDEDTMRQKTQWADGKCLGGVMYWSVDQDVHP
ncbi:glycoside hydrolase superfamily [Microdochium trichocladiopsis]|uniref:chitinase n=1 Tax=Microdochium trichocladiopsis TaxID=1682393 RepID=A0A9P8XV74_9PEZI|nr:glycoside hydrolase superfamily [Microdochium trichocladiopsis]KAH7020780.1 glycoside hydrolase superfamily [Microdochium trichocladiopsis]